MSESVCETRAYVRVCLHVRERYMSYIDVLADGTVSREICPARHAVTGLALCAHLAAPSAPSAAAATASGRSR